jgi:class 3 adenylate cyclase
VGISLDTFLEGHPWPDELRSRGEPMDFLWCIELSAPPEQVWPFVIETSRLNRALGLEPSEFLERDGVLEGSTRNAFVLQQWVELPWQWVATRTLTSIRDYSRGLAHISRGIYQLEPSEKGSALYVYFGWIPRGWYGRLALKVGMSWLEKRYRAAYAEIDRELDKPIFAVEALEVAPPPLPDEVRARVATIRDELIADGVTPASIDRLIEHIESGDETELYRIQILPLARRWGVDEDELLSACLHATRHGLLDLSWDVICPHCRGVRFQANTLGDVPARGECEVCDIQFAADADNALEITFHVHPSVRQVPRVYYCSAEASTKLHIHLQQRLAGGESRDVATRLPPGRYRARLRGQKVYRYLDVGRDGNGAATVWQSSGDGALAAGEAPTLRLVNDGAEPTTFVIENIEWTDNALKPSRLFSMQQFRDLFSEEYLAADIQLSVGEQTILFTDMVGSTRFYGTRGDPEAFMEVKKHFSEVFAEVREHDGAVIKTIGDAVMAAFTNPLDGLLAAEGIMRRFRPDREGNNILLRASLNTGPCIAVNLNSGIDYFGGTVNIAAKLQSCAEAGQIAFAKSTTDSPGVLDALRERGVELKTLAFEHAALKEPIAVFRWDVHDPRATATADIGDAGDVAPSR